MKVFTTLCLASILLPLLTSTPLTAQSRQGRGFSNANLTGCYGANEQGDGAVVVCYDGNGKTTRSLIVNAPDGAGGRRILSFESTGTYSVNANGTGIAYYTNRIAGAPDNEVTDDFVITGTASTWVPGKGQSRVATEVVTTQRESGVTVSLVTGTQKRIADFEE